MILTIDHLIFGNGRGMKSPYFNDRFYWLVDGETGRGELYTFMYGFGAQLHSYQWAHPRAGERRRLIGRDFRPVHSTREWGRVCIAWSLTDIPPHDIDGANAIIRHLKSDLDSALVERTLAAGIPVREG